MCELSQKKNQSNKPNRFEQLAENHQVSLTDKRGSFIFKAIS